MSFIKESASMTPIVDTVFAVVEQAAAAKQKYGEDAVVDAVIGSLYTEDGKLAAYPVVFETLKGLDDRSLARYAASFTGNPDFRKDARDWVLKDNSHLFAEVIATPGGTGAVSISIENCLEPGQTLIIPEIAWGSYALMAQMDQLELARYSLFEGDHFNLDSFKSTCKEVMEKQNRLVIIINDPCHNPTGYSMTREEWKSVVDFLNECSRTHSVVLINDIAYIDYAYEGDEAKKYISVFDDISDNFAVVIAFSISKSMTSYGLRCGAAIVLGKTEEAVEQIKIVFEKAARATWSNINNGAMKMFSIIMEERLPEYLEQKADYVSQLKARSDLFLKQAKEAGLSHYPYKEGFFITLDMDNETRDKVHAAFIDENIYTVKVNKGIRIAVCSLPVEKIGGLPARMQKIIEKVKTAA
jgi:aspartate aminotransferase/aromatic-amino-acid transaminase